jgi:hypothetical protein
VVHFDSAAEQRQPATAAAREAGPQGVEQTPFAQRAG